MSGRVRDGGMRALEWVEKQIETRGKGRAERLEAIHSVVAEPEVRHRGESLRKSPHFAPPHASITACALRLRRVMEMR